MKCVKNVWMCKWKWSFLKKCECFGNVLLFNNFVFYVDVFVKMGYKYVLFLLFGFFVVLVWMIDKNVLKWRFCVFKWKCSSVVGVWIGYKN